MPEAPLMPTIKRLLEEDGEVLLMAFLGSVAIKLHLV
jgi:hypothetical protein